MGRVCASCSRELPRTSYTGNQWSKPVGVSRCAACVHGHQIDIPVAPSNSAGRHNNASRAVFEDDALEYPFAEGAFRWVAKGTYTHGEREGQACVCKWFKSGSVFSKDYFTLDIKAAAKALEIVDLFNNMGIVTKTVKINVPAVWTGLEGSKLKGVKMIVEPFIQNYEKFNSNTGWVDESTTWGMVMQALSHFSYHVTRGNFVLCDLQGGIYQKEVVLSDPVILSQTEEFGVTDLGPKGIRSFFSQHECNPYCRDHSHKPANPRQFYEPQEGSLMRMRRTVPTSLARPAASSRLREISEY
ncbi:Alpha-protein kinase 1 [Cyphellophora attinorum]|uniref:Alpha-protein kinase 1 n=1 Tax=Cyphellophora attinorum TaxID=1664694 RepID=A0A0N1H1G0_9EURO|nr:Alpha-protein kinase 1 [Phialophora attinorum]KPI38177.1 Alpha-protein kinase 1 [Phialophora attinorum]